MFSSTFRRRHSYLPRTLQLPTVPLVPLPVAWLLQNVTEAASEEAACNLEGNVTDCCEQGDCTSVQHPHVPAAAVAPPVLALALLCCACMPAHSCCPRKPTCRLHIRGG